jgi:hypothetical protein
MAGLFEHMVRGVTTILSVSKSTGHLVVIRILCRYSRISLQSLCVSCCGDVQRSASQCVTRRDAKIGAD